MIEDGSTTERLNLFSSFSLGVSCYRFMIGSYSFGLDLDVTSACYVGYDRNGCDELISNIEVRELENLYPID